MELFKVTYAAPGTRTRKLITQVRGWGNEGSDDTAEPIDKVLAAQPWGLAGFPNIDPRTSTFQVLGVRVGDQVVGLMLVNMGAAPFATALERGEVRLHNETPANVRARASGELDVNSDTANSQDIVLNGGTHAVGRVGDQVQVTIPAGSLTLAVSGGGTATGPAADMTLTGTITAGAPHVKA